MKDDAQHLVEGSSRICNSHAVLERLLSKAADTCTQLVEGKQPADHAC